MNLLLDSHIWLWTVLERHRLSTQVDAALRDARNEWWISAATFWEITILNQKKRMDFDPDGITWIRRTLQARPVHEAPINREVALLSRTLDLGTEDPVDRFLGGHRDRLRSDLGDRGQALDRLPAYPYARESLMQVQGPVGGQVILECTTFSLENIVI